MRPVINVACVADAKYGPYAGIAMTSVLMSNAGENVHLHLFSDGVLSRDIKRMRELASEYNVPLSVYDVGAMLNARPALKVQEHYSRAAYGRLFMAEVLPPDVEWVVYIDCDVICVANLTELFEEGTRTSIIGAVRDVWIEKDIEHKQSIGLRADDPYFNSGVLLVNVQEWRQRDVARPILEFLGQGRRWRYVDQDGINHVLKGEISELPRKWNVLATSPEPAEIPDLLKHAGNIHFCAGLKPWHFGYKLLGGVGGEAFRRAKAVSPWRWMMPDLQTSRIKRKIMRISKRS
jgi:lipopolysaccharide biosynthesis glycosyltransferase